MKKAFLLTALFLASWGAAAQDIVSHNISDFNQIVLTGKLNVVLEQGNKNSFEVTLHNITADRFSWTISDGKLNLRLRANTRQEGSADVKIVYKHIDALDVASASIRNEGTIESDLFEVKVANGGNINIAAQSKDITVNADGNSAVTLSGNTLYLNISANSKAKIDARALQARSAMVNAQVNAEIFVWGTERLEAKAGSNSVIYYKGTPEIFKTTTNLMGSIEQFAY